MPDLRATAARLTARGRGILAADESIRTMSARLEAAGVAGTEDNRRDYREMLITTPGLSDVISGVILSDETFGQRLRDGRDVPTACRELGMLPGIKVDTGTTPLPGGGGALVTEGLDGLGARLADYAERGAAFAKWRAVIDVTTTSSYARQENATALARYAALCQEHGIVPIVEPEVLADGDHDLVACAKTTTATLSAVVDALAGAGVDLSGIVLKPNFVTPGLRGTAVTTDAVAAVTFDVLRRAVPTEVSGIAFLSGGHSTERACAFLSAINAIGRAPWPLTFSFGRALVSDALQAWRGEEANAPLAQQVLLANCERAARATESALSAA
jgi:fructose-bisphosphate aldolase class I